MDESLLKAFAAEIPNGETPIEKKNPTVIRQQKRERARTKSDIRLVFSPAEQALVDDDDLPGMHKTARRLKKIDQDEGDGSWPRDME